MNDEMPITREDAGAAPSGLRLGADCKRRFIAAMADRVIAHADELTRLDSAIGDGDHGHNMKRGFEAVLKDVDSLAAMQLPDLLKAIGTKLVMTVGGASGPLYGTLFLTLGKALPEQPSRTEIVAACGAAIAAVKTRGKSDVGQKTMLDVLVPTQEALAGGASADTIKGCAARSAEATVPMMATRGRASFLRERSIGHMDPGARSSSLIIAALCDEFVEG
jgi:phosphoenolpyruvate---glycerone phosphotransferase subunit DhaL